MFIPDPDFYPSRIQQQNQKRRKKIFFCPTIFLSFIIVNNFIEQVKNTLLSKHQELKYVLPKNLLLSYQKYGFRIQDPRSAIREPGSGIKKVSTRSWIGIRNTGFLRPMERLPLMKILSQLR
jgi:hypothetical protein